MHIAGGGMSYWLGGRRRVYKGAGMKCRYKWDSTD